MEEMALQDMIDRLIESERCCSVRINLEQNKTQGNQNLKTTIPSGDYDRSETTGECKMFKIFG
jgi:hypothetical protein